MKSGLALFISPKGLSYKDVKLPSLKSGFRKILLEHFQPLKELVAFGEFPGWR
jgi:hypothetical protein